MELSVIIINYNTFQLTCECIKSVLEKTSLVTFEIILVDNASSEINPKEFLKHFPQIKLVESNLNLGFAKGNNLGITHAEGEFILLLNSDTILCNNALAICRDFLIDKSSVAAVSARLQYPDRRVQHNCQRFPSIAIRFFELLRMQKVVSKKRSGKILLGPFFDYASVTYPDWIWGTFFMFRKTLLYKLPNKVLADDFFMYVEDMQWCMEFRKLGYEIAFEPSAQVVHLMGKSGGPKQELMNENLKIFMRKYYSRLEIGIIRCLDYLLS